MGLARFLRAAAALAFAHCAWQATAQSSSQWPISDTGYTDIVQWDHYSYILNGQRTYLFGGEFHPFRIPVPELWEDILQKMKAIGMNSVSFYTHWGYHEPTPGTLDFETGARDISRLLQIAKDVGIFVTARPGPYINAELSAGGLPLWLTTGAYGTLRSNGSAYTEAWTPYIESVAQIVTPFQLNHNGTVINYQIENEYNSQWTNAATKTPNPDPVAYMKLLEQTARDTGIEVAFTHNDLSTDQSWSTDFDTVGAGGDVNVHGYDSYPTCWSCNPSQCSSSHDIYVLLDYDDYFTATSPNQPNYFVEFQGGKVTPLTGYPDGCADDVGYQFRNLYHRHNVDQRLTAQMLYMAYGGTSWGWLAVPFLGTSYGYESPIREDRSLAESFYELKNLGLFFRVAEDLRKTDRIGSGTNYTTNADAIATELRNPDTGAAFYVTRHTTSTSNAPISYQLNVQTSLGNLTIPQLGGNVTINDYTARIVVTDFPLGNSSIVYSTAEVLTYLVLDGKPTLILWVPTGLSGEAYITGASNGTILSQAAGSQVQFQEADNGTIIAFVQNSGRTVVDLGNVRLILVDRSAAATLFVPALTANPQVSVNETIAVLGPSLVRSARIEKDVVYITGDTVNATSIEVFAPSAVKAIVWNGKHLKTARASSGGLQGSLEGPTSVTLPALGPWKAQDSLPEVQVSYIDTGLAWLAANHTSTHNSKSEASVPYLFADDYGFHSGSFIYRGIFNGTATGAYISIYGGEAFGFSVYLNGDLLGAYMGSVNPNGALTLDFPTSLLQNGSNLLAVVMDNSGHDEGASGAVSIRGILNATLIGGSSDFESWRIAGTAGGSTGSVLDPVRGVYNEGGWAAERLGWHLPGFDDSAWPELDPSAGFSNATATFYRTSASLDFPEGHDVSVQFTVSSLSGNATRALLYVNGYQYGRFSPWVNTATRFPVPPGILNYGGDNIIGLLVWAQSTEGAQVDVDWSITEVRESSLDVKFDAQYLQPSWNETRLLYA
ncbi:glycoside hydrolase superfamily [Xylariales sp. PMI_506]|nr:glycoside hydrolase superfamily [Xylariales sp. PMI_506]